MRRAVLIVNPFSTSVTRERVAEVEAVLRARVELETWHTEAPGHATELATAAANGGADAVVVFSGDGTYNEAINGAAGLIPFGFLPGGGASILPRALGLPRGAVEAAGKVASALAENRTRSIGLGRLARVARRVELASLEVGNRRRKDVDSLNIEFWRPICSASNATSTRRSHSSKRAPSPYAASPDRCNLQVIEAG